MDYIVSAATDIGISKDTNQDSFAVKVLDTSAGRIAFAVLCDGMGGLSRGEVASATVVAAFSEWAVTRLPALCAQPLTDDGFAAELKSLTTACNEKIMAYGRRCGVSLGTTVTVLLLTGTRYYILNVGDTRVYELIDRAQLLTRDQTLVAQEVTLGILTPEEARRDPRRSVLLQCVGASQVVTPDFFFGETAPDTVYMLCSDGFRHEISREEIYAALNPGVVQDAEQMKRNMNELIDINKSRNENDNISVITIRTR